MLLASTEPDKVAPAAAWHAKPTRAAAFVRAGTFEVAAEIKQKVKDKFVAVPTSKPKSWPGAEPKTVQAVKFKYQAMACTDKVCMCTVSSGAPTTARHLSPRWVGRRAVMPMTEEPLCRNETMTAPSFAALPQVKNSGEIGVDCGKKACGKTCAAGVASTCLIVCARARQSLSYYRPLPAGSRLPLGRAVGMVVRSRLNNMYSTDFLAHSSSRCGLLRARYEQAKVKDDGPCDINSDCAGDYGQCVNSKCYR